MIIDDNCFFIILSDLLGFYGEIYYRTGYTGTRTQGDLDCWSNCMGTKIPDLERAIFDFCRGLCAWLLDNWFDYIIDYNKTWEA